MTGIVQGLMGGGGNSDLLQQQIREQERAQRTARATAINQEADADQEMSAGRRGRGRRLLSYIEGASTLG